MSDASKDAIGLKRVLIDRRTYIFTPKGVMDATAQ